MNLFLTDQSDCWRVFDKSRKECASQKRSYIRRNEGSALVIVLWTVVVLGFAVAVASERVELIMGDTAIHLKRFEAELRAEAAIASLNQIIAEEKKKLSETKFEENSSDKTAKPLNFKKFMGTWQSTPTELDGGMYWIEITDEQSKINWLKTPKTVWKKLFELIEMPEETSQAWFDALSDWQDQDDLTALNGAE
jgi:hypothetical protein